VPTPNKKNKQAAAPSASPAADASLAQAIEALEMLQWKTPLPAPSSQLMAALQGLVSTLLPAITSIAVPHSEVDSGPAAAPAAPDSGSLSGYAVQLALMAIKRVLEEGDASAPGVVDLDVVVACAQQAPDSVVRNAALLVVAAMAALRPESTLDHVLQVSTRHPAAVPAVSAAVHVLPSCRGPMMIPHLLSQFLTLMLINITISEVHLL
jgi:hypothetical protein